MEPTPTRKSRAELTVIINGHEVYSVDGFFDTPLAPGMDRSVVPVWDIGTDRDPGRPLEIYAKDKGFTVQAAKDELTSHALRQYSGRGNSIDIRVRYADIS